MERQVYKQGTLFINTVSNMVGQIVGYGKGKISKLDYYEVEFFSRNILTIELHEFETRHTQIFYEEFDLLISKDVFKIIDLDLKVGDKFVNTMNGTVGTFIGLQEYGKNVEPNYKFKISETDFDSFGYQPGSVNIKVIEYSKWQIERKIKQGFIRKLNDYEAYQWKCITDLRG